MFRILLFCLPAALICRAATIEIPLYPDDGAALADAFAHEVELRLTVPADEQLRYATLLATLLAPQNLPDPQYVLLVDRSPFVQATLLYWFSGVDFRFIGASPVSTGKPGRFDYFVTPVGVFAHTLANPDFRAEGTLNENGILGYGRKGMRVYDFGWQQSIQGWGHHKPGTMRLQMHSTDPVILQPRLGTAQSKGCIRIHASLNTFLDRHAILDADYDRARAAGQPLWVVRPDREPTPWPGSFLVIVDTARAERPAWSPRPAIH